MKRGLIGLCIAIVALLAAVDITTHGYNTVTVDTTVTNSFNPDYVSSYDSHTPNTVLALKKNDIPFYVTSIYSLNVDEGSDVLLRIKVAKYSFIANRCYLVIDGESYSCKLAFERDMMPELMFNELLKAENLQ